MKFLFGLVFAIFGFAIRIVVGLLSHAMVLIVVIGVFTIAGYVLTYIFGSPLSIIRPNTIVSFELQTMQGGRLLSTALSGKKYIIFFTSATSQKCTSQIIPLTRMMREYDFDIYCVAPAVQRDMLLPLMPLYNTGCTQLLLDDKGMFTRSIYIYILPHTSVVDENGKIIVDITGAINQNDVARIVKAMNSSSVDVNVNSDEVVAL